ncbi:hypothetical protein K7432_007730 [Basidiobolus ranarum]|uniref:DUF1014-domain-containing protein n=1 Tax=Basidiobolus ranarum TaxID=34480 RepID=A0ABR2WSY4_9FUNG
MAKKFKGENTKVAAAKDRKAKGASEAKAKKDAQIEARESAEWSKGAKKGDKKEEEAAKKAEKLQKKLEAQALLDQETKEFSKQKPIAPPRLSGAEKKAVKKTQAVEQFQVENRQPVIELAATNIDDALDLLDTVNDPSGSSATTKKVLLDRHPERRAKAAYTAYEERELPKLKQEYKGLRLTQLKQILWKDWQKSPENPFNQASLAYDSTQKDQVDLVEQQRLAVEERLRI